MVIAVKSTTEFDDALAAAGDKTVFVDFFATWCGPCVMISPVFEELEGKHPGAVFLKVDVDVLEEVAARVKIRAMPTFMAFKHSKKVAELVGPSPDKLRDFIKAH